MPIPVSRTRITLSPPSRATVISTRPPAGVYLSALSSRLNTICSRRAPSPNTSTGSAWTESETSCSCMREHDVSLSVQAEPVEVLGDGARLEQIVFNLLDNALKYTPAGGRVEMTVARDGGESVIRVRDTGMGIAPEMLRHVFELFMRADAPLARSRGGLGLGLTLVHRLVELHGGRVSATSEGVGRGSEFVVSLPLIAPAAIAAGPAEGVAVTPGPSRRVLV